MEGKGREDGNGGESGTGGGRWVVDEVEDGREQVRKLLRDV